MKVLLAAKLGHILFASLALAYALSTGYRAWCYADENRGEDPVSHAQFGPKIPGLILPN